MLAKGTMNLHHAVLCVLFMTSHIHSFRLMTEQEMKPMIENFITTPELIVSVVMHGLPGEVVQRQMSSPQFAAMVSGQGVRPVGGQGQVNNTDPQSPPPGPAVSNEPLIISRKKRSPFNNDVLASFGFPSHPSSGGFNTNSGFNYNSGFNSGSKPTTTTTIPRVCNNNLPNCGFITYPSDPSDVLPTAGPITTTKGGFINYPHPGNTNSHPFNTGSSSHNRFFSSHSIFGNSNQLVCPRQIDQGLVYQYSADNSSYPATDIANELLVRSLPGSDLLFQCLSRQIIFPNEPPQIFLDPFLANANETCPKATQQLWSYESFVFTGRCFPLVNFQELAVYKTCLQRFCNCQDSGSFSNKKNMCITEYTQISIWAYCPALVANRRIVRDRILVPNACACAKVDCESTGGVGGFPHGW